jgi:tetratricopeptide (TPR) repeat protein/tRNA A-37 threonylcarbamoyl transferase component Bud32
MAEDLTHTGAPASTAVAATSSPPANPPGYELFEELGRGGMGVICRARDVALDRDVAIKLLAERYPADSLPAQRFLSEARITAQLQHPGIPAVHQVGTLADGRPFLAMKLIKGNTLEAILKQPTGPAAERGRLLAIFEAVCHAVGYAHAHRVIHRDLKPANIMVGAFGEVQVMDWGLAKVLGEATPSSADAPAAEQTRAWTEIHSTPEDGSHTQAGSLVGTPAFIPPEQALGEIDKVTERSDVFGLGALLAVILTGQPPYVGETFEAVRVQAARGKLEDCYARLKASGAEPELVGLCKACLAFEPAERPRDAGAVAQAVAGLRAAAEERARTAEREQAAAAARSAERRKRRQQWLGAAAVLAVALVGGLTAVVVLQRRANAELAAEKAKVQARFDMAVKAIETFHTGVSEDALLKNPQFEELRTKLLKEAAGFYDELQKLLQGQTNARSQRALGSGYYQLAELTEKIGRKTEALAVHEKALTVRRELAEAADADIDTRLDVCRSLLAVGLLRCATGDKAGGLTVLEEGRDLARQLAAHYPTDSIRSVMASGEYHIGTILFEMGKVVESLAAAEKARAIQLRLAVANPVDTRFQSDLARGHLSIGYILSQQGKTAEALAEIEKAHSIRLELAKANPTVSQFQRDLGNSHLNIGVALSRMDQPARALAEYEKARDVYRKLVEATPAVNQFQRDLANSQHEISALLADTGKPAPALVAAEKALAIRQKLAAANPSVTDFQSDLAFSYEQLASRLSEMGKPTEALAEYRRAEVICQKLANANPAVAKIHSRLAGNHISIGWLCFQTGKAAEALAAYEKGRSIYQKLVNANPDVLAFQNGLANCDNNIGWLHARQTRFTEAFAALDRSVALGQKLIRDHPGDTECISGLGESHAYRGWARAHAGQSAAAVADLRKASELWAGLPILDLDIRFERSRALALLARLGSEANSGVTTAEAAACADQAMVALHDAFSASWNRPDELKGPEFDALRGREDFKKLLAEVEAKAVSKGQPKD